MSLKKNTVLLLNASYEPIGTIGVERAICLQFLDKIYIEEYHEDNRVYHSPREEWKIPSVVRLKHYVPINKRRRHSATKRDRIYIRDKFKCGYCGAVGTKKELTLDHIIPRARKGENSPENLVTCCFKCNQKKKDHTLEESGMKLIHPPKQFKLGLDKVVVNHWAELRPSWAKFLFLSHEADQSVYE